jgi:excinuclease UvrABC helicase subunit UvrB
MNDFRVQVAEDIADELKKHYEDNANEMVQNIMRDVSEELTTYIKTRCRVMHSRRWQAQAEGV